MSEQESVIVAIELGSSKIAGIAGKKKDGTMQILAYAEEKSYDCVRRGVVYNIEKTTQSIKNVIGKLEASLKMKVARTYIGLSGQSVHSLKNIVRQNMVTPTYINQGHIDAMTDESHDVQLDDYELIGFFTQGFTIDSNVVTNPVGIMGTNIEGDFLNIVANVRLRNNIKTCFENLGIDIVDYRISAFELANNILSDAEKRSGCVMVDFGAGTTTIVVLKNNIVRKITTLPLGINTIRQDLCDLQIEESEAEQLLQAYADASADRSQYEDPDAKQMYTTSDGREFEVSTIRHIIWARMNEIILNVKALLNDSEYADKLIGGVIVTGGGANIDNIDKECASVLNIEKIRIARKIIPQLIKNSDITALSTESPTSCTIISLLHAGDENCVCDEYTDPDIFASTEKENEIAALKQQNALRQKEENDALAYIEEVKTRLRSAIVTMKNYGDSLNGESFDRQQLVRATECIADAQTIITDEYEVHKQLLADKDRYKQSVREAEGLIVKCDEEIQRLQDTIREVRSANSSLGRIKKWLDSLMNE